MGWLKRALGLAAPQPASVPRAEGPLGLAARKALSFDTSLGLLLDGETTVRIPPAQQIWSEGVIDLGEAQWLSRYYLDDEDFWLQVKSSGARDGQVDSLVLFNYLACVTVTSEDELRRLAGPQSPVGLPTYTFEGATYERVWGSEAGQTELVPLLEQVSSPQGLSTVRHQAMLYARDTGLTRRSEFLLFSVEENERNEVSFSTSLGLSLFASDLTVV